MILISIVTFIYIITHNYFYDVLQNITTHATTPPAISVIISVVILIFGSLLSIWVAVIDTLRLLRYCTCG